MNCGFKVRHVYSLILQGNPRLVWAFSSSIVVNGWLVQVASVITPVPGGVGPMTVAMLMQNTVISAQESAKRMRAAEWRIRYLNLDPLEKVPRSVPSACKHKFMYNYIV